MSKFKGTPGPWNVSFHGSDNCWIVDADKDSAVAKVMQYKGDAATQKANFNVISAAPELLDVLSEIMEALTTCGFDGDVEQRAKAAINKALGH